MQPCCMPTGSEAEGKPSLSKHELWRNHFSTVSPKAETVAVEHEGYTIPLANNDREAIFFGVFARSRPPRRR